MEVPEVVINIVTMDIVGQASLASCDYEVSIDEFDKAGFTKEAAIKVGPPMVAEAKAKLECRVIEVKPLGENGGAGNLVICEVVYIHVQDGLFDEQGRFDPMQLHLAARHGGEYYSEAGHQNLFTLPKPDKKGIGFDALPTCIRSSKYLTGNELAALAGIEVIPSPDPIFTDEKLNALNLYLKEDRKEEMVHRYIKELIQEDRIGHAWQVVLAMLAYEPSMIK